MTRSVHFEPEAASELVDAGRWYEEQAEGLGAEFIAAVDATIELLDGPLTTAAGSIC